MDTYGVTRSIVNRIPDYDVEEAKLATAGLLVTGEGKRVMAGLTCLAERHSDNVMFDIIKTSPWTATIVISSHRGEWSDRSAEVQVHLASDHREVPVPSIHVSGSDNQVHSYKIPSVLAAQVIQEACSRWAEVYSAREDLVEARDNNGYIEPVDSYENRRFFSALGRRLLEREVEKAFSLKHSGERFAPIPDSPLFIGQEGAWTPAEYEVPAGYLVKDVADVPFGASFTAVFADGDKHGFRGVSSVLHFTQEWMSKVIDSYGNDWGEVALAADSFVVHGGGVKTLRALGAEVSGDKIVVQGVDLQDYEDDADVPPVKGSVPDRGRSRRNFPLIEGEGYSGALPGEPSRRFYYYQTCGQDAVSLQEKDGDGNWRSIVTYQAHGAEGSVEALDQEDSILWKQHLCRCDLEQHPLTEPTPEEAAQTPAAEADDDGIPDWERQLTEASEDAE